RALLSRLLFAASAASPWTALAGAQAASRPLGVDETIRAEFFVQPPNALVDAVLAPRYRNVSVSNLSPDRTWFINEIGDGPVTMDVFSKPFHELGGLFVDFRAHRSRSLTIRSNVGLQLISATNGSKVTVQVPAGARVSNAAWSPDGRSVAFFVHTPDATHIYVADLTGRSTQITRTPVLATLVTSFDWTNNSAQIAAVLIPAARPPMPLAPAVPQGPRVKLAEESDKNRLRTYQSLLATPHEQALLEWHSTGQLALIDVKTRAVKLVGAPAMLRDVEPSPDGKYLRLTRVLKPFSYVVPVSNFGSVQEIWDSEGKVLAKLRDDPLNLGVDTARAVTAPGAGGDGPQQGGRREITWHAASGGITFLEQDPPPARRDSAAAEAADSAAQPRRRDRVKQWLPPFDSGSIKTLYESNSRITTHRYSADLAALFLSERNGQQTHEYAVFLSEPSKRYTLARYRGDDVYGSPGQLVLSRGSLGTGGAFGGGFGGVAPGTTREVQLSADGEHVYFYGFKYDKNPLDVGPRTFIDKVNIKTAAKSRIYESDNNAVFERVIAFHDLETQRLIVSRESEREVPQAFLRRGDRLTQLTENRDYTPDLTRAPRESFIVERPDGFKFKVNVTLPPDYQKGTRLPAMFWFYPREFAGQEEYDRGARTY
ncbi:MAG: TolB family protein, partial [Gemmatimonadaceae bacterium]